HERDAEPQIGTLVTHEARRDALADDVALLKEELPRRHGGANDRDDQQDHFARLAVRGKLRDHEIMGDLHDRRMNPQEYRNQKQAAAYQQQRETLEAAEIAGS